MGGLLVEPGVDRQQLPQGAAGRLPVFDGEFFRVTLPRGEMPASADGAQQILEQVRVDLLATEEQVTQTLHQVVAGPAESAAQPGEESLLALSGRGIRGGAMRPLLRRAGRGWGRRPAIPRTRAECSGN